MRGQQGKLKEIVALKEKYRLLVDDAHGFGTLGKQELEQEQDCQMVLMYTFLLLQSRWLILVLCSC
jgi:7-keto-8-aminopelargonate synthetase-like enzyme